MFNPLTLAERASDLLRRHQPEPTPKEEGEPPTGDMARARWFHDNAQLHHWNGDCAGCKYWGPVPDRTSVHPWILKQQALAAERAFNERIAQTLELSR